MKITPHMRRKMDRLREMITETNRHLRIPACRWGDQHLIEFALGEAMNTTRALIERQRGMRRRHEVAQAFDEDSLLETMTPDQAGRIADACGLLNEETVS